MDKFKSIPMPKEREEDWRYTEIEKLKLENFDLSIQNTRISATSLSEDLIEKGVILTDINTALEKYPEISQKYFFKNTGIDKSSIIRVCKGKQKTAGTCEWKYIDLH